MKKLALAMVLSGITAVYAQTIPVTIDGVTLESETVEQTTIDKYDGVGFTQILLNFEQDVSAYTLEVDYMIGGEGVQAASVSCDDCGLAVSAPIYPNYGNEQIINATIGVPQNTFYLYMNWILGQPEPGWEFTSLTEAAGSNSGGPGTVVGQQQASTVPEPATLVLMGLGLLGVGLARRWRSRCN